MYLLEKKASKIADNASIILRAYQKEIFESNQKPTNEKISETTLALVKFWNELRSFKEGMSYLAKYNRSSGNILRW